MIAKGPFNLKWGDDTLAEIETVEVDHEINSEGYEANSGNVYQIEKSRKFVIRVTLLATDLASLAVVLPQYFVAKNAQLADGTVVTNDDGALDIKNLGCSDVFVYHDLDISSCGSTAETFRLKNARSILRNIEIGKIRKIVVEFIGEPVVGGSALQFIEVVTDYFQLDNDELFLLDNGENLIL